MDIEAAVERVRVHAMGMKTVDDLKNVIQVLRQELTKLDLKGQKSIHISGGKHQIPGKFSGIGNGG